MLFYGIDRRKRTYRWTDRTNIYGLFTRTFGKVDTGKCRYDIGSQPIIPEELFLCIEYEEGVSDKFELYSEGQKKAFVDWINAAKTEQTKVDRIAKTIAMVQNGEKMF